MKKLMITSNCSKKLVIAFNCFEKLVILPLFLFSISWFIHVIWSFGKQGFDFQTTLIILTCIFIPCYLMTNILLRAVEWFAKWLAEKLVPFIDLTQLGR